MVRRIGVLRSIAPGATQTAGLESGKPETRRVAGFRGAGFDVRLAQEG
jgi:hypothetical protein